MKNTASSHSWFDRDFQSNWKTSVLRLSVAVVYFWFGVLKFFTDLSPAEPMALETLTRLSFHQIPGHVCYLFLAIGETLIGTLLLVNRFTRIAVMLALIHMFGTFTPLVLQPEICFGEAPFGMTLIGQYIIKNIIIASALLVICPDAGSGLVRPHR